MGLRLDFRDRARGMMVGLAVIRTRFEGEEHFEDLEK